MASYGSKSDDQLKEAYQSSGSYSERSALEKEMNNRGYLNEDGEWYEMGVEDTGPSILWVLFTTEFWKGIGILILAFFAYELISYPMDYYFNIASAHFPAKYYMEGAIVRNKFEMNLLGFMMAGGLTLVLFKLGTTIRKYAALLFVGIALYSFVTEVLEKNTNLSGIVLASLVFLIAILGALKIKKSIYLGLWMIMSTTIGFILIGNQIIQPWIFLETAGFLLVFLKGNLIPPKRKH